MARRQKLHPDGSEPANLDTPDGAVSRNVIACGIAQSGSARPSARQGKSGTSEYQSDDVDVVTTSLIP